MTKVIDFDAFRAEQKVEPIELKISGRSYELPSSVPASLALDIIRRNSGGPEEKIEDEDLAKMGSSIFGSEELFMKVMTESGITLAELPDLFRMIFALYSGDGEPDAPNPATPAPSSRKRASSR